MILGIGTDIVEIARIAKLIEKFPQRFVEKCFTAAEREIAISRKYPAPFYAARFAAKEAMLKALGIGVRQGVSWQDISITSGQHGKPEVTITGRVAELTIAATPKEFTAQWHLSLSHERDMALAFVVLEVS